MKVLYISKNIPLPHFKENNIIIKQKKLFEGVIDIDLIYPKEFTPKFLAFLGGRFFANSRIKNKFHVEGVDVTVYKYFRLPIINSIEWILCFIITSEIKFNYDLLHSHYVFPDGIIGYRLSQKYKVPFVITVRNGDLINIKKNIINKLIFKFVLNRADKVIALTRVIEKELLNFIPKEKVTVIPNFIDDDFYRANNKKQPKAPISRMHLITVAKFIPRKNIDWLVEYASNNIGDVDLTICGDGELRNELKLISAENVYFKGQLNKQAIINELDKSDVFILTSFNETFGLVYAEAAARKNIVIGLTGTGLDGINNDGFYFVSDKEALFKYLDHLLSVDKSEIEYKKSQAFDLSKLFSRLNVRIKLENLYLNYHR